MADSQWQEQGQDGYEEGYYDEQGEWHYYETANNEYYEQYDQSYYDQAQYQESNYSQEFYDQQQLPPDQQNQHPYPQPPEQAQLPSPKNPQTGASPGTTSGSKSSSRIDPRSIPRPLTVRKDAPVFYYTNSEDNPPPSTTEHLCIDDGNCSPRFMRLTSYQVPASSDLVESTRLSVGAVIQPLAELCPGEAPVPTVEMGAEGPVRCGRCHAYINPFFSFSEDGQRFTCNLCDMSNPVPHWYHCNVDANGKRRDRDERPELVKRHLGSVDFKAPPDYSSRPAPEPCFVFVVDVSYTAVMTGLMETAISAIRSCIRAMAEHPRIKVGIITYSSSVHVYSLKNPAKDATMMVVSDVNDVFVPVPVSEILVHPSEPESLAALERLLDRLGPLHADNRTTNSTFGAAVHVAVEAMSSCGGKLLVVQSSLPRKGMGALDEREESSLYGSSKERQLYLPQDSFYQVEATTCAEKSISVDMFVCANAYVDIATTSVLSSSTGGQLFYYPNFHVAQDGYALEADMLRSVTRTTGFEGVLVVRTCAGLKVVEYLGNFFRRHPDEIEFPAIDCDKAFAVRLEHEDNLNEKRPACIQCALLYTNTAGERRIRVHTIQVAVTSSIASIFRHADLETIVNLSMKQSAAHAIEAGVSSARSSLQQAVIDVLFIYRKRCASVSSSGQLILPETLKLLPLYTLGILKNEMLAEGSSADDRCFLLMAVKAMSIPVSVVLCLPRLYALHDMKDDVCIMDEDGSMHMPELQIVGSEFLESNGIYLLDNARVMFVYVGDNADPALIHDLFGVPSVFDIDPTQLQIYPTEDVGHLSTRVSTLIEFLRFGRPQFNCVRVVHSRSKNLPEFTKLLVESATVPPSGSTSSPTGPEFMTYVQFLCNVHKAISDRFLA